MRVLITDLLTTECELTGKCDVECVRVVLDEESPEAVIATSELIRLLRFRKKQCDKAEASKASHSKGEDS